MPEFILIIAMLTTESSYKSEIERPATNVSDTTQFWFGESQWRIRTYSIDHDIHVYSLGDQKSKNKLTIERAKENIEKNYSDILDRLYVLKFKDPKYKTEVTKVLASNGLTGSLEISPSGVVFYNPDNGTYKTQSTPK